MARLTAVLVGATLLVASVTVIVRSRDDGVDHPEAWDPRVADLAEFVEEARGLDFDHPVHVDFLSPEDYTAVTTAEVGELQEDELAELDRGAAQLRALGVVSGPLDLRDVLTRTIDAGTLAFYSPEDERIRIRGTELTVGVRVTLVHELTHALQDQHFDLGALLADDVDSSAAVARRGLAEGDAMRVEDEYVVTELSAAEQDEYEAEAQDEFERSETGTAGVPPFVQASFATPYALGAPLVQTLFRRDGNDAIDEAFEDPPETEEHLFDPASYAADEEAEEVALGLDDDEDVVDEGPFGSPSWYLVLAERIDPTTAFRATLGWAGDGYAVYERDGATCVRAVFAGDDEDEEGEMAAAIEAWVAAMPGDRATGVEVDGHPGFDACDPGPDVDLEVTGRSLEVLALPNVYGHLVAEAIGPLGAAGSRCFATEVLAAIPYERLIDPDAEAELSEEAERIGADAARACRSGER